MGSNQLPTSFVRRVGATWRNECDSPSGRPWRQVHGSWDLAKVMVLFLIAEASKRKDVYAMWVALRIRPGVATKGRPFLN